MSVKSKEKPEEKTKKGKKGKKKGHRFLKTLVIILVLGAVLVGASAAASAVTNKGNREKLDGFPAVPYDAQLVPTTDGFGNVSFVTDRALKVLSEDEVVIDITMREGDAAVTAWGCDLTYAYVKINGDYRT